MRVRITVEKGTLCLWNNGDKFGHETILEGGSAIVECSVLQGYDPNENTVPDSSAKNSSDQ